MLFNVVFMVLGATAVTVDDWTPPDNPDPQAILQEAQADARAKRYETALAKHVWFHQNALSIQPALYGVRLSFALSDWKQLAKQYPPALIKLKEIRDVAERKVMDGKNVRESFHDMASINSYTDEQAKTKEVFEALDAKNSKSAQEVFDLAQPSLIKAKAYALVGKYISPEDDFARMREMYRQHKKLASDARFGARQLEFANNKFANDAATLVAVLTVNNRKKEAEKIASSARDVWDDESLHSALDKALTGVVPDPWPSYAGSQCRISAWWQSARPGRANATGHYAVAAARKPRCSAMLLPVAA
jgi:hypothetical protein